MVACGINHHFLLWQCPVFDRCPPADIEPLQQRRQLAIFRAAVSASLPERLFRTMFAPTPASALAICKPRPFVPPVIQATFPSSLNISSPINPDRAALRRIVQIKFHGLRAVRPRNVVACGSFSISPVAAFQSIFRPVRLAMLPRWAVMAAGGMKARITSRVGFS